MRLLLQLMSPNTQAYIKVGLEEGNSKWEPEEGKTENVRVEQWGKNTYRKKGGKPWSTTAALFQSYPHGFT